MDDLNQLKSSSSPPWADEKYFETVIDNDPALQFGKNDQSNLIEFDRLIC
jgi:hypothetical protein